MLKKKSIYYLEPIHRTMTEPQCDHCKADYTTGIRVRTFKLGRKRLSICFTCACDLMQMQNVVKEWVE